MLASAVSISPSQEFILEFKDRYFCCSMICVFKLGGSFDGLAKETTDLSMPWRKLAKLDLIRERICMFKVMVLEGLNLKIIFTTYDFYLIP